MAEVGETPQSATAKVRVARCPKCGKLLREMTAFGNYCCGSCNGTLQAKQPLAFSHVNKSESQNNGTRREGIPSNMNPETNKENCISDLSEDGKLLVDTVVLCKGSLASGTGSNERGEVLKETNMEKHESSIYESFCRNFTSVDHHSSGCLTFQGSCPGLDVAGRGKDVQVKNSARMGDFHETFLHKVETRECGSGLRKMQRSSSQGLRFSPYPAEGPPAFHNSSIHANREYHNIDLPDTVEHLEKSREELLKKLDELRDQLSRSCELKEPTKEKVPVLNNRTPIYRPGRHDCNNGFYAGASSKEWHSFHPFPSIDGHDVNMHNPYHTGCDRNGMLANGEPMGSYSQICKEEPYHVSHKNHHVFSHGNHDIYNANSHGHAALFCQPACPCSQCFRNNWRMISQHPQALSTDGRPYCANFRSFYPVEYAAFLGGESCCSRMASSSFLPSQSNFHHRSSLTAKSEQRCRPVAGAAPFVVCDNCLQLLLLSYDLLLKNQQKLRCGSCCHVISLEISGKQLRVASSAPKGPSKSTYEDVAGGQHPVDAKHTPGILSLADNLAVECHSETEDEKPLCTSHPFNHTEEIKDKNDCSGLDEPENKKTQSSSQGAVNKESDDLVLHHRDLPNSSEMPLKYEQNSHVQNLPLHMHLRHPSSCDGSLNGTEFDHVLTGTEVAITNNSLENQNDSPLCDKVKHNFVMDATLPTEFNLLHNEHSRPYYCENLLEDSKKECCLRMDHGSEHVITGRIKKSLKDMHWSSHSLEKLKYKVSINGHLIPDRRVKKAEKQAGRIYPGDYWYDYKAGFWGVMGQPCLGIIPPFIEEFNYPMPSNCAGGNTNVLVNGRELHHKDLELLIGRGLPSSGGRSYIIEISGRLWDAVSGEELDSLGKLAPTIEKQKHGFGMRVLSVD